MFTKVLIANRGEIALRVIRACRELGIASVAVYSDADARAPHVREADEAVHIGPAPSARELPAAATRSSKPRSATGAEAIHPGYGFLSEREWFARAVRDAGLVVHRPAGRGDRRDGQQDGGAHSWRSPPDVPVVPGTTEALARRRRSARRSPSEFGYPVLLKAAAGGGGKGMRVVRERERAGGVARRRRGARRRTPSATTRSTSRSTSSARGTSRSRCSATSTARCSRSTSASARCSAATRR